MYKPCIFAKICKALLAIFAALPRLFSIYLFSILLLCPLASLWGQDASRLKSKKETANEAKTISQQEDEEIDTAAPAQNYKPYYNWYELSDSLFQEYKTKYPLKWQKDSTYYALENKKYLDTLLLGDYIKQQLFYPNFKDSVVQLGHLTDNPLPNEAQTIKKPVPLWIFFMVLMVLVGVLFLKYTNYKLFRLLFLSIMQPKSCDEALQEQDTPINIYNLGAALLCTLVFSIIIWFVAVKPGWLFLHNNQLVTFLLIFTAISVFYLVRFLFIMLAAALLEAEYTYGVLVQVTISGNFWLAMAILPVFALINATFIQFNSPMLYFYLAGGLLIYLIIKQIRVIVQVASGFPHSIIYLILYLCALEIAPYLAVFKAIIK